MTTEASLFTALKGLVGNRCYPNAFPLTPPSPTWPAIRYVFVGEVPAVALCGDSGDDDNDRRVQLDLVATTYAGVRTLRASVIAAMQAFNPPAVLQNSFGQFDAETKTHRETLEYVIHE
jgi:hypothetical protein